MPLYKEGRRISPCLPPSRYRFLSMRPLAITLPKLRPMLLWDI